MNLTELIAMTKLYARDSNGYTFNDTTVTLFLNQAVDRVRQYKIFRSMSHLSEASPTVSYLPDMYHYLLALYASSRCFDMDERFYEGTEKRNEFEYGFDNLIADIEAGNIEITDGVNTVDNTTICIDAITDVYFDVEDVDVDDGVDGIE